MDEGAAQNPSAYLIYVNPFEFRGNQDQFKEFIAQHKFFTTWWNYTPSIYVVTSRQEIQEIKESLLKYVGDNTDIFVARINPMETSGYLSKGAWPAFSKDIRCVVDPDYQINPEQE